LVKTPAGWSFAAAPPGRAAFVELTDGRVFDVASQPRRIGSLIAGRVWSFHEVTHDYRSAQLLRESEEKFWKAFRSNPDAVCIATVPDGRLLEVNERFVRLTGFARDELVGRAPSELGIWVTLAERDELVRILASRGGARDFECRVRRKTGEVRVALLSAEFIDLEGVACMVGIARDITERKRAEEELQASRQQLRDLALRLEAVREEERTGIAREIHDELGQVLTGLRIDLSWIGQRLPRGSRRLRGRIATMVAQLDATIDSVQRISSELRPSVLDDLGLTAAIEWEAAEFERRTSIPCRVDLNGHRPRLAPQRATAVFRILQEALTNVARHANARHVEIVLRLARGRLTLTVRDDGRGITEAEARSPRALGLVGMRERALAWDGELDVRGEPQRGTVVTVRLPLGRPVKGAA
jgi:PAS domain S-box-containing protein